MTKEYSRGSEWRKWDLHVHSPYSYESKYASWDAFVTGLKQQAVKHGVEVVGINDYFTVDGYEKLTQEKDVEANNGRPRIPLANGQHLYIFPVVELRLDNFGDGNTAVNIHVVFNPKITPTTIRDNFLEKLNVIYEDTTLTCKRNDLIKIGYASVKKTALDINLDLSAIPVSKQDSYVKQAMNEIVLTGVDFAAKADDFKKLLVKSGFTEADFMIVIANRGHGGLDDFKWHDEHHKTGRSSTIRKNLLRVADACFSNSSSDREFLLGEALPKDMDADDFKKKIGGLKPCIWGSDAHEPNSLFHPSRGATTDYTWIKADPTFEGLQQIRVEPKERVVVQATRLDEKEPYKVISKVTFSGTNDFPVTALEFNGNLCSVIGSRSSGKSALLAYIAYSIDPDDTIKRQLDSQLGLGKDDIGPAAGKSWRDVEKITCEIEWASGDKNGGKVVYIPQNYLFSISSRPADITSKIEPVLFKRFPSAKTQYEKTITDVESNNQIIASAVGQWFELRAARDVLSKESRELGNKAAIKTARDGYQKQVNDIKSKFKITERDLKDYQTLVEEHGKKKTRLAEIEHEITALSPFLVATSDNTTEAREMRPTITFYPSIDSLPTTLNTSITEKVEEFKVQMSGVVKKQITDYHTRLQSDKKKVTQEMAKLAQDNKDLIERYKQNKELEKAVGAVRKQNATLALIDEKEKQIKAKTVSLEQQIATITSALAARAKTVQDLAGAFGGIDQAGEKVEFGIECSYDADQKAQLADKFNRVNNSPYVDSNQKFINIEKIRSEPGDFLEALYTGTQKIKLGLTQKTVAQELLTSVEETRFTAVMEGDKIGGFTISTMTPGKRALFALTLILSEADGAWPLLIDQPEDDLDSRSIYEQIVPYIVERKKERQIIMVSHNANLVVGADSEQIIVANKQGSDRKNRDSRMFDYLSGALESSKIKTRSTYILETCGIREHACAILDGGAEAFEKRKQKYQI